MAYKVLTGTNPQQNVQNNMKTLYVHYQPATPISVPLGQEFDIASIFPGNPTLTALFKTKKQGTFDVMSRIPLSLLACLYGLEGNQEGFVTATSDQKEVIITIDDLVATLNAIPPTLAEAPVTGTVTIPAFTATQQITGIYFAIQLFPGGRIFGSGDLMELTVQGMPSGANIDVYVSDYPYMTDYDKPFMFRTQTVLENNDYSIDFAGTKIIFPNDTEKVDQVQMSGNQFVQWDLIDFYANADSDLITNKTTYNSSPFIFLDTKNLRNIKLKAKAQFNFYYKANF